MQGQPTPELVLAQYSVADHRTAIYANSDSTGPVMGALPELDNLDHDPMRDIGMMGIDPDVPYYHLDLAGEMGVQTPAQLAAPTGIGQINAPTFYEPSMSVPALKMGDLQAPEIEHIDEFSPDPQTGDLLDFCMPGGLDIHAGPSQTMPPDPVLPDLDEYDRPAGLEIRAAMMPDPVLPDLQSPQLEQDVHMSGRPGDLAADALGEMYNSKTYQDLPTDNYKELYMEQRGMNTRRSRHMGMMDLGLDREEHEYR